MERSPLPRISDGNKAAANRIIEIAQIAKTAFDSRTTYELFDEGQRKDVEIGVNSIVGNQTVLFLELLKADARSGRLATLLSGGRS